VTEMAAPRPSKNSRLEEENPTAGDDSTTEDGAESVRRTTGAASESLGEKGDGGEGSGDEDEEDEGVREQMNEFFSELDVDLTRQKRNLMTEGLRVPRRRGVLPAHLHSVMGSANLRLARGDSAGAVELCLEVIRQGLGHSARTRDCDMQSISINIARVLANAVYIHFHMSLYQTVYFVYKF
jgi:hypothetical protein